MAKVYGTSADAVERTGVTHCVRVIARMNVGGPARHVINLTEGLADLFPTVLVTGEVDAGEADMVSEAQRRGLTVHRIPELGRSVRPGQDAIALFKLVRLLRELRPSIIHTHTAKAGAVGRIASVIAGVPYRVHTFHGHVFEGYFGRAVTQGVIGVERALARITDRTIAISESQRDDLTERFRICPAARVRVIPLGLELDSLLNADLERERASFRGEFGLNSDEHVVTIVGRLAPIKNHGLFLDAAAELLQQGRRVVFMVAGDGNERSGLEKRAAALGIERHVRFLGWRSDLARLYAGADVVALTSRNEGTPVCLIEALAARRAVVATDVGGVSDLLEKGHLGRLVPRDDKEALAGEIGQLLDNPSLRRALGETGARAVGQRYSVERLCEDTSRVYYELVGSTRRENNLLKNVA